MIDVWGELGKQLIHQGVLITQSVRLFDIEYSRSGCAAAGSVRRNFKVKLGVGNAGQKPPVNE
ncbi:hypothetical protein D3C71_2213060 [compost metagenome]